MDLISDRRALHRIPELDRNLPETLDYLRSALEPLPCKVFSPAESALCAFFDFGRDHSLAFRADMDALPVSEATGLPFASCHPGKMHACGHDGHMAIALELARRLARREVLPHNMLLVFQPAEETTGGAQAICHSGVFDQYRTKAIFGLHLWPDLPAGVLASIPGGMMCRSSEVTLTVTGRSAHVARAGLGRDALEAAAQVEEPSQRFLRLRLSLQKGFLAVRCENSYTGKLAQDGKGNLLTPKENPQTHGFGIAKMSAVAEKYKSILDIRYTDSVFTVQTALKLPGEARQTKSAPA